MTKNIIKIINIFSIVDSSRETNKENKVGISF